MKVIDLLNKIANGEEVPKKVKYDGQEWEYNPINDYEGKKYGGCLLNQITLDHLTDEVEIIEEPRNIKKINRNRYIGTDIDMTDDILDKLDEIIDYINKGDNNE